jgi:hypothetical protein
MTAWAPATPCPACGNPLDPARATYDKSGVLVCAACAAKNQIAEGEARASSSIVGTAVGVLVGGVLSWTCLNMFAVLSIVTCIAGVSWLVMIGRDRVLRAKLGTKLAPCIVATSLGLLCAASSLLIVALSTLGVMLFHR